MKILPSIAWVALAAVVAAEGQSSPFSALRQQPPEAEAGLAPARSAGQSLIGKSTLLSDGSHWTLVPRGAVVHIPPALGTKVVASPTGRLVSWTEFFTRNRAWISTSEVVSDSSGNASLPSTANFENVRDRIVVAVHRGGPISIAPEASAETTAEP